MKLLWFPEKISSDIKCDSVKLPTCRLAAETAVVRHGTPLFLPGWSNEWNGFVGIGVAIERLGRHIDERFAHRYYSQTVVAVKALPAGMSMDGAERCSDAMFSLDGSIVLLRFTRGIWLLQEYVGKCLLLLIQDLKYHQAKQLSYQIR